MGLQNQGTNFTDQAQQAILKEQLIKEGNMSDNVLKAFNWFEMMRTIRYGFKWLTILIGIISGVSATLIKLFAFLM